MNSSRDSPGCAEIHFILTEVKHAAGISYPKWSDFWPWRVQEWIGTRGNCPMGFILYLAAALNRRGANAVGGARGAGPRSRGAGKGSPPQPAMPRPKPFPPGRRIPPFQIFPHGLRCTEFDPMRFEPPEGAPLAILHFMATKVSSKERKNGWLLKTSSRNYGPS